MVAVDGRSVVTSFDLSLLGVEATAALRGTPWRARGRWQPQFEEGNNISRDPKVGNSADPVVRKKGELGKFRPYCLTGNGLSCSVFFLLSLLPDAMCMMPC